MANQKQFSANEDETGFDHVDAYVGGRAHNRRLSLEISIEDLAGKIGLTPARLEAFEAGIGHLGSLEMRALARALGVRIHFFFEREEEGPNPDVLH